MMEIKLEPSLSSCIETTAKRAYKRVLSLLLRGEHEDRQLVEELELLRAFLETSDFGQLRCRSEEFLLAGGRVEFRLKSTEAAPGYEIEINNL